MRQRQLVWAANRFEAPQKIAARNMGEKADPDSGIMKTRRGWVQGYNAQAVVTPDQIILAADVTTEANDVRQLTGMLNQAQANVAAVIGEDATLGAAVAGAGYWSETNAESQTEECELFIATQKDRKQRAALREATSPAGADAAVHDGPSAHGPQTAHQARPRPLPPARGPRANPCSGR